MSYALALPTELTIYTVGELRPLWMAWLTATLQTRDSDAGLDAACRADAAAVEEIDAAGVQLLLALSHSLAQAHLTLRLTHPSAPLTQACEALGVAQLVRCPQPTEVAA